LEILNSGRHGKSEGSKGGGEPSFVKGKLALASTVDCFPLAIFNDGKSSLDTLNSGGGTKFEVE
jgi:hypothetical protein